jgi:hypothetical protein
VAIIFTDDLGASFNLITGGLAELKLETADGAPNKVLDIFIEGPPADKLM